MTDHVDRMIDAINGRIAELERPHAARIAELVAMKELLLGEPERESPGKAEGAGETTPPAPEALPQPAPPARAGAFRPGKHAPGIARALASGPKTAKEIAAATGVKEAFWWEAFKRCPWFERANPGEKCHTHNPSLWRLSEAGRAALAELPREAEATP